METNKQTLMKHKQQFMVIEMTRVTFVKGSYREVIQNLFLWCLHTLLGLEIALPDRTYFFWVCLPKSLSALLSTSKHWSIACFLKALMPSADMNNVIVV